MWRSATLLDNVAEAFGCCGAEWKQCDWCSRCVWIPCKPAAAIPSHRMGGFNISSWLRLLLSIVWPWAGSSSPPLRLIVRLELWMLFMAPAYSTSSNVRKMANSTVMSIKTLPYHTSNCTKAKSSAVSFYKCHVLRGKESLSCIFIFHGCHVSDNVTVKPQTHTSDLIPAPHPCEG